MEAENLHVYFQKHMFIATISACVTVRILHVYEISVCQLTNRKITTANKKYILRNKESSGICHVTASVLFRYEQANYVFL